MEDANLPAVGQTIIAGFWVRILAFLIDCLVLGVIGACLGLVLFDFFMSLGEAGRLIGFVIALSYFGVMNSRVFRGQTLGKKIMKIRVSSKDGASLNLMTSFYRSSIVCIPLSLNGLFFDNKLMGSWLGIVIGIALSVLVFGIILSIVYLLIFNRKTRQSLYDILIGSYVIRAQDENVAIVGGRLWRGHVVVVAGLILLAVAAPIVGERIAAGSTAFSSLLALQQTIGKDIDVRNVSVFEGANSFHNMNSNTTKITTSISISAVLKAKNVDRVALVNRIAQIVLAQDANVDEKDFINITLVTGYDIGIASSWKSQQTSHSPAEWRQLLQSKSVNSVEPSGWS